jgi:four helix bundle protein
LGVGNWLALFPQKFARTSRLSADREPAHQFADDKEFIQFLRIAQVSNGEVRALLYVAGDRGHLDRQTIDRLVRLTSSLGRMLKRLELYLRACTEGR